MGVIGTDALRWHRMRARFIVSGDYAWDDATCIVCDAPFAIGDDVVFRVHRIELDHATRPITFSVPVHLACRAASS